MKLPLKNRASLLLLQKPRFCVFFTDALVPTHGTDALRFACRRAGGNATCFPTPRLRLSALAFRGLRPRAPSGFSLAGKGPKRAHRGQVCPLCTPACFVCYRRGCLLSFDNACRRALAFLPLTYKLALRPPPLAEDNSYRLILRKCFCAAYAEYFV